MRSGTSGLMLTENDNGSIWIEVVDYGVSEFGGGDWESRYDLNKENAARLFAELSELYTGSHEEMLLAAFGKDFDIREFIKFCNEHDIKYEHMTWW